MEVPLLFYKFIIFTNTVIYVINNTGTFTSQDKETFMALSLISTKNSILFMLQEGTIEIKIKVPGSMDNDKDRNVYIAGYVAGIFKMARGEQLLVEEGTKKGLKIQEGPALKEAKRIMLSIPRHSKK